MVSVTRNKIVYLRIIKTSIEQWNTTNDNIGLVRHFFAFFSQLSRNNRDSSRSFHTKDIYRGYEYLSNNNKTMDMDVDLELEMNIARRELRVLLLREFRLGHKATSNICGTMGTALVPSAQER